MKKEELIEYLEFRIKECEKRCEEYTKRISEHSTDYVALSKMLCWYEGQEAAFSALLKELTK